MVAVGDAADKLVPLIKERIAKLKVGDGLDKASEMGPLINKAHRDKVAGYVDQGVDRGRDAGRRRPHAHGRRAARTASSSAPCLFDNVKPAMAIYKDEIFGPGARR